MLYMNILYIWFYITPLKDYFTTSGKVPVHLPTNFSTICVLNMKLQPGDG